MLSCKLGDPFKTQEAQSSLITLGAPKIRKAAFVLRKRFSPAYNINEKVL